MKKTNKSRFISMKSDADLQNTEIFDPDDNLYNDPLDHEISTLGRFFSNKRNGEKNLKNDKKVRYDENLWENTLKYLLNRPCLTFFDFDFLWL